MAVKPKTIKVTVTTAGTAVKISSNHIPTSELLIEVPTSNTGGIYGPGGSDVASANANLLLKGEFKTLVGPQIGSHTEEMYLDEIYIDAENNGDVAYVTYWERS